MVETPAPPFRPDRPDSRRTAKPSPGAATVVVFAIAVAALYFGREVFVPLALAILLSFLLAPLVLLLRRLHAGRVPSVIIAVFIAVVAILGLGSLIGSQLAQLAENLPQYQSTITEKIRSVRSAAAASGIVGRASSVVKDLGDEIAKTPPDKTSRTGAKAPAAAPGPDRQQAPVPVEIRPPPLTPLQLIQGVAGPLLAPLATGAIVIVFLLFILLQREDLRDRFIRLAGARDLQRTTRALDDGVRRLSRYFLMQSAINAAFGVLIGTGLSLIGMPNAVLWGVLAMLLRFVPYIGAPIAAVFAAALAIAVDPGWSMFFWTLGLFAVVEPVMGQVVEPLLYSHSTGLSAIAVVVAAVFWTWLWGPLGLLLSTPLTVCLVVLGRHVEHLQFLDVLLSDEPALAPEESFYQRMLAGDPDEAARQAEEFLKDKSLSAYYDAVAIKGLALAQFDVNRGVLDHDRRVQIKEAIDDLIDDLADHDDASPDHPRPGGKEAGTTPSPALAQEKPGAAPHELAAICVAGRGSLDEAAAAMLAQLLAKRGIAARVVPSRAVSAANILHFDAAKAQVVCLSYLEPGEFTSARYLARRLRRKLPRAKILLGLWTLDQAEAERRNALAETGVDLVVTSLEEAVARVVAAAGGATDVVDEPQVEEAATAS
jgi:predicted PurR-regulated permease PerM